MTAELLNQFLCKAQRVAAQSNRSGGRASAAGADPTAGLIREVLALSRCWQPRSNWSDSGVRIW
jgi:hypothetical protein